MALSWKLVVVVVAVKTFIILLIKVSIDRKRAMKISYLQKSIGYVFIAVSSGIKSFGTLLSQNLLFLCLTTTYIEYVICHCHKIPPCKRI